MRQSAFILFIFLFYSKTITAQTKNTTIATQATIKQMLQGKWQSVDDKKNYLMFEGDKRKEMTVGFTGWDEETIVVADQCMNELDKDNGMKEKDRFISSAQSDMCWYIVNINKEYLTLSYMGRGNTFKYRKVK